MLPKTEQLWHWAEGLSPELQLKGLGGCQARLYLLLAK